ncbi:prepilin-type N-terminal cleavage/methylation domain-containing protein [Candidatus Sumerlaeota bacterium]|nr:prepilin-type N-terminal cleavage/methylation domain-containing protein [Candidatus Sumerlaeota bacterium]
MNGTDPGSRRALRPSAFTLIELLIVVAIIAILAAIAVPNFLEAQTRSKVSRARSDMRTIATALEGYMVDNNHYPPNPPLNGGFYVTPIVLTTPQAYITSWPVDPFKMKKNLSKNLAPSFQDQELYYDYYTIITTPEYFGILAETGEDVFVLAVDASGALASAANRRAREKYGRWLQWSVGPDAKFWIAADDFNNPLNSSAGLKAPAHLPWGYSFDVPYDPSNGSTSFGNLIRSQIVPDGARPYGQ